MSLKFLGLPLRQIKGVLEKQQAAFSACKEYFSEAWTRYAEPRQRAMNHPQLRASLWQERLDLFHDNPADEKRQALAWRRLLTVRPSPA